MAFFPPGYGAGRDDVTPEVRPSPGRLFRRHHAHPAHRTEVGSESAAGVWARHFGGDPAVGQFVPEEFRLGTRIECFQDDKPFACHNPSLPPAYHTGIAAVAEANASKDACGKSV